MSRTSRNLHRKLQQMAEHTDLPTSDPPTLSDLPSVEGFIKDGLDPIHASYAFVQHITAHFAEGVSQLPQMSAFAKIVGEAEDEYMPCGPPMSPLTTSYFMCWALFDLEFQGSDTLARCQMDANDVIGMNPDQFDALRKLSDSRMGIYEHIGMSGPHVRLRELITGDDFECISSSGYKGRARELWYVRLLPPLLPDLATYHIVATTPYILTQAKKSDWLQFLKRAIPTNQKDDQRTTLHRFLKYGPTRHYWNEFVFKAYHHHQTDAIFLAGIPDLEGTLPHA